jgi:hypothetical protein
MIANAMDKNSPRSPDLALFKGALQHAGITMEAFARQEAGVSRRFLYQWFAGERDSRRVERAVCRFYLRYVEGVIERHRDNKHRLQQAT